MKNNSISNNNKENNETKYLLKNILNIYSNRAYDEKLIVSNI